MLAVLWGFLGYNLSEQARRTTGRTPWGMPSLLWAFLWFLSLLLGLILYGIYLITRSSAQRRSGQAWSQPPVPGGSVTGPPQVAARRQPDPGVELPGLPTPGQLGTHHRVGGRRSPHAAAPHAAAPHAARRRTVGPDRPTGGWCRPGNGSRRRTGALATGVASRPQRPVPLPVVERERVDLAGVDRRAAPDRHQPGPADWPILRPPGESVNCGRAAPGGPAEPARQQGGDGDDSRHCR